MPKAKVQLEDGRIATFEVPEGTTEEEILEFASTQDFSNVPKPEPEKKKVEAPVFGLAAQYGRPATKDQPVGIPEWVTGKARGRYEIESQNLPELISTNPGLGEGLKVVGTFLAESDPEKRAGMLSNLGFEIKRENGVDYVIKEGEKVAVVNKPGWSRSDAYEVASVVAKYTPAARITGMAKSLLGRIGIGGLTAGGTAFAEESTQAALGGDLDWLNIALAAGTGAGSEIFSKFGGKILEKLSPKMREKAMNAKSVEEMRRIGVSEEDLRETAKKIRQSSEEATELGIRQPMPAESIENRALGAQVRSEVTEPAKISIPRADEVQGSVEQRSGELVESLRKSFGRFPEPDTSEVLRRAKGVAEDVISTEKKTRAGLADIAYKRAWDDSSIIDPDPIIAKLVSLSEKQRVPEIKKALRERAWMLDSENGITAEEMQQVIWDIRDEFAKKGSSSIKSQTRALLKEVERDMVAAMDVATGGRYSQADKLYASLSSDLTELIESKVGQAAGKKDIGLDTVLDSIFKPKPHNRQLSKEFMRRIAGKDPDAAKDLYQAYFVSKIDNLPEKASPSQIIKSIYGGEGEAQNVIASLAPDGKTAERLMTIKRQLELAKTFEDVNTDVAARSEFVNKKSKGIANMIGKLFTPGFSVRHGLEGVTENNRNKILFEAAISDRWATRFDEIADIMARDEANGERLWGGLVQEIVEAGTDIELAKAGAKASAQTLNNE